KSRKTPADPELNGSTFGQLAPFLGGFTGWGQFRARRRQYSWRRVLGDAVFTIQHNVYGLMREVDLCEFQISSRKGASSIPASV
ncbi:MAG: hypothetical protein R6U70_10410, partial [Bacillota bacterium]